MCSRYDAANCEWSRAHSAAHCVLCASASWSNKKSFWHLHVSVEFRPERYFFTYLIRAIWCCKHRQIINIIVSLINIKQHVHDYMYVIVLIEKTITVKHHRHQRWLHHRQHQQQHHHHHHCHCYPHPYRRGNHWIGAIICRSAAKTQLARFPDPLPFHSNDATWLSNRACNFVMNLEREREASSDHGGRDVLSQRTKYYSMLYVKEPCWLCEIGLAFWVRLAMPLKDLKMREGLRYTRVPHMCHKYHKNWAILYNLVYVAPLSRDVFSLNTLCTRRFLTISQFGRVLDPAAVGTTLAC